MIDSKKSDLEKKATEIPLDNIVTEYEEGEFAELVIDIRKILSEYDIVRIILPETPGERITTENGTEMVFFQEETAT